MFESSVIDAAVIFVVLCAAFFVGWCEGNIHADKLAIRRLERKRLRREAMNA